MRPFPAVMAQTPLHVRLGLWRLTRHPTARRIYNRVADAGVVFAQLDWFERETAVARSIADPPGDVTVRVSPAGDGVPPALRDAHLAPGDLLVLAERDGERVGHCCLADRPVYVPELCRRLVVEGSYLWQLAVVPAERGRGIGTALVARGVTAAAATLSVDRIAALVAPENVPSRRAFASLGFRPTTRYTSYGVAGSVRHQRRPLDGYV